VVGGAAYAAGRAGGRRRAEEEYQDQGYAQDQGYQDQGYAQQPAPPPQEAPAAAPGGAVDYDELKQLGELHANGTLTDEEFAAAKAKILGT
jgi:hypothetical protein